MEGESCLVEKLVKRMKTDGDVTFSVGPEGEEEEIKGSSLMLSTLSPVFEVMFNETWKSQQEVVKLPDIRPEMFRLFLKLIFTEKESDELGLVTSSEFLIEDLLHLFYIAKKYDVESVQSICRNSLKNKLSISNAILVYETFQTVIDPELEDFSHEFVLSNINHLLEHESFAQLSHQGLAGILQHEDLQVSEVPLFEAVDRWAVAQCTKKDMEVSGDNKRSVLGKLVFLIRFPVMTLKDFYRTVQPTGILTAEEVVAVSCFIMQTDESSLAEKVGFNTKYRPGLAPGPPRVLAYSGWGNCPYILYGRGNLTLKSIKCDLVDARRDKSCPGWYHLNVSIRDEEGNTIVHERSESFRPRWDCTVDLEPPITLDEKKTYCVFHSLGSPRNSGYLTLSHVSLKADSILIQRCIPPEVVVDSD